MSEDKREKELEGEGMETVGFHKVVGSNPTPRTYKAKACKSKNY
ncbi:MAG: hypothetical protein QXH87_02420 [Candidatus Bathyarchaeia archaeon]